ncbi:protein of unknown function DUF201 [Methanosalsum zhilinae DSM 4017]|uniref:ATP-grasp domain-containing protein n=1 Tax=Methanosalsum zhilinae (strain DSM 4017 / NBRC 107636 / OCM 62 / WeN5) TaxID=679901 RepID=F7XM96_METZD|nr:ATP-grasp domain-containing protein [Methanosalsum zhilinae]AEH60985.1 protein of unknown function DUF201 [Methanosalsum zhilinae DSM 4017]
MNKILVIGYSSRHIVNSAKNAGYSVYAIDAFCDFDLDQYATEARQLNVHSDKGQPDNIEACDIYDLINSFNVDFDFIVLGSGFEMLDQACFSVPVLNNSYNLMKTISDKKKLAKKLNLLGFPHPEIIQLNRIESVDFPLMLKPAIGGGGFLNRKINDLDEFYQFKYEAEKAGLNMGDMIVQKFVDGTPASVSLISSDEGSCVISTNEQLIGTPWLTRLPYAYCGNITPINSLYNELMCSMACDISLELGLVGSNGIDFIITDNGPVVTEINGRFQGSLDTVETSTGINLFDAHVKSFNSQLPSINPNPGIYSGRAILYSNDNFVVNQSIFERIKYENTKDIPCRGAIIGANEPITSIFSVGNSRENVLNDLKKGAERIASFLNNPFSKKIGQGQVVGD